MRFLPLVLALSLTAFLAACDGGAGPAAGGGAATAPAQDIGEVLATVNGLQIGSKEFEQAAARKTPAAGDSLSLDEKKEVMNSLVEEKLLYEAALKKGLDKDPKVQKVMVNTLLRQDVYGSVKNTDFTDEQLQAYYEAHKAEFIVPEKVQIKRILIKVTPERADDAAKAESERIRGELVKNPASFKDLAAQHSEDPFRRRGGDVGFVAKEGKPGLEQAIVDKAFTLKVEEISEVFKTDEGYNVIQVANRREAVERTFQQMKGSVLRKVKNEKLKELYETYVANLKTGAKVDVKEDKLALVEVKPPKRVGPGIELNPAMGGGEELMAPPAAAGGEPPAGGGVEMAAPEGGE